MTTNDGKAPTFEQMDYIWHQACATGDGSEWEARCDPVLDAFTEQQWTWWMDYIDQMPSFFTS